MKYGIITLTIGLAFSSAANAFDCKTVMGGCPADTTQVTSAHMRVPVVIKPSPQAVVTTSQSAQKGNETHSKLTSKKSGGSLVQSINKALVK